MCERKVQEDDGSTYVGVGAGNGGARAREIERSGEKLKVRVELCQTWANMGLRVSREFSRVDKPLKVRSETRCRDGKSPASSRS